MNKEKLACLITFSVCMCVSSSWHQLNADYAEPEKQIFQNKTRQIWTTPLKALHFLKRGICRQKDLGNDGHITEGTHLCRLGLRKLDPA